MRLRGQMMMMMMMMMITRNHVIRRCVAHSHENTAQADVERIWKVTILKL
jgi:hypothetical protein